VYRILTIDGGGVRGIVPALVLAELEKRAGKPVADLFDLVAATSTGAIVGLALLRPGAGRRPARSALEVADFYESTSKQVFHRSGLERVLSADGHLRPKYDVGELERRLKREFGDVMLSAALRPVLITSYDLKGREPYFFKSRHIVSGEQEDQPMWRVARSTSAAPTYFVPSQVLDKGRRRFLIDGGTLANNPSVCAYAEAVKQEVPSEEIAMVSIGTGAISVDYATPQTLHGGDLAWAKPMFDIVLDAQEDAADFQMGQLLPSARYFRFQADLPERVNGRPSRVNQIDDASRENLLTLRQAAEQLIATADDSLTAVAGEFSQDPGVPGTGGTA
jgi:patatin-like phospholipase/acyl hydrolase